MSKLKFEKKQEELLDLKNRLIAKLSDSTKYTIYEMETKNTILGHAVEQAWTLVGMLEAYTDNICEFLSTSDKEPFVNKVKISCAVEAFLDVSINSARKMLELLNDRAKLVRDHEECEREKNEKSKAIHIVI